MAKAERRTRKPSTATPRLPADIALALAAAQDKKALDLVVLDLRKGTAFTDFFVIGTGANVRQVQAIADAIEEELRKRGVKPALIEGRARGEWVLLDYFDFIVHIFQPATREFYGLERLWGDAERIEVPA
jgi:ribosome-associated protein